ncbi:MAG: acyl-CoA reductase, partial [Flavobacteriales bacterium]|nr:acyl-CoA reductase [Flavobacteriales bacterium]
MIKPKNVYKKASLIQFGKFLRSFLDFDSWPGFQSGVDQNEFDNFKLSTEKAELSNAWFSRKMIRLSMESWAKNLNEDNIDKWMSKYEIPSSIDKNVLIICAGNLPMVGFHDIVCCILLNLNAQVKLSKNDNVLIPAILNVLYLFDSELQDRIKICNEKPDNYNYVIATGSNNSNRYFEYYFGKFPHIFRRNRTSIAVVHSEISNGQLKSLSHDMLQYYGLGCRSVTKLYLPEKFSLDRIYN